MITKKSEKNADLYNKLFYKASQTLGLESGDEIVSINEYFYNLVELAQSDLQYTVLPLDEETFKINANTRTIDIPNDFKSGVGVQGDQVAEIIYFEIDRYFDATDLNTQNICIEWENAKGIKGISAEYVRDLITIPDKIIFGWPLTTEITEKAGRVKFSVRFYTINENTVVYSFSTKPQTITINEAMDFDLTDNIQIIDAEDMIKNRIKKSALTEEGVIADTPIFLKNLEENRYDIDLGDDDELEVQAKASGAITYYLQKREGEDWNSYSQTVTYLPIKDGETKIDGKKYYTKSEEDGKIEYIPYVGNIPHANPEVVIYDAWCICEPTSIGTYRISVQNRVNKTATATAYSNIVEVPAPIKPRVKTADSNGLPFPYWIGEDTNLTVFVEDRKEIVNGGEVLYHWYKDDVEIADTESYNASEVGMYQLVVSNKRNGEIESTDKIDYRVTNLPEQPVIKAPTETSIVGIGNPLTVVIDPTSIEYDEIIVKWYKENTNTHEITYIQNADVTIKDGKDNASYTPEETGVYYATLTTVLNQREAEPKQTVRWSVS